MLYFVGAYVAIALVCLVCFVIYNKNKKNEQRLYEAAEKIISSDLLQYSLKNPYTISSDTKLPSSRRIMIGVKTGKRKQKRSLVFDPEKVVYIGRGDYNQIVIYNNRISERHCCIFLKDNRVWISDLNSKIGVTIKSKGKKRRLLNGDVAMLYNGDTLFLENIKIEISIFIFDINHK